MGLAAFCFSLRISAFLCASAVNVFSRFFYRRGAEERRDTQRRTEKFVMFQDGFEFRAPHHHAIRLQVTNPNAFSSPCVIAMVGMFRINVFVARL